MEAEKIIKLAQKLKKQCNDTFKLCEHLNIKIRKFNLNPTAFKASAMKLDELPQPVIALNPNFTLKSQKILCAHELGHIILHDDRSVNHFGDNHNGIYEYEANLFAVALLFNQEDFCIDITKMSNYLLKGILDENIKLKTVTNEN